MRKIVIDASAILALVNAEKGADVVEQHLDNCVVTTVNVSEAACILVKNGMDIEEVMLLLTGLFTDTVEFSLHQAFYCAGNFEKLTLFGISLGDRACISYALMKGLPILTADRVWAKLTLPVDIQLIR